MNVKKRTAYMWGLLTKKPALTVPWYLGCSWLYYVWDVTLIEDTGFDQLCRELLHKYDSIEHRHKNLVKRDALVANTGFHLRQDDYPIICRSSFNRLAIEDGHIKWKKTKRGQILVRALG